MKLDDLFPQGEHTPHPCEFVPECPICGGQMEKVYSRPHQTVCLCTDCRADLTVPASAWEVVRLKRERRKSA